MSGGGRALPFAATALLLVAAARPAAAEPLRLDPALDATLLGSGAVLAITLEVITQSGELAPSAPGAVDDINPLDRWVAEGSSDGTAAPHHASNVVLAVAYGAAVLVPMLHGYESGADTGWTDLVLFAEAIAWNGVIADLVKLAVRRPRPLSYVQLREGTFDPDNTDGTVSFFSGHTATAATIAATFTTLEFLRQPCGSARPWLALVSGALVTATTGALRVAAKRHFVTDVAVGAVVGTAVGVTIPLLHRVGPGLAPSVAIVPRGATVGLAGVL